MGFQRTRGDHFPTSHVSNLNLWTSSLKTSELHQHRYPEHVDTHKYTQTWWKTTRPRSCSETSVRVEVKVHGQNSDGLHVHEQNLIHNHANTHTLSTHTFHSHSHHPRVHVLGAVEELWFRAEPGGPDSCLAPHIQHTSIPHTRPGSPKTNTRVCRHCRNSTRTDWPRVENVK